MRLSLIVAFFYFFKYLLLYFINLIIAFIIQSSTDTVLGYRIGFSVFIIVNIITVIASDIGIKNDTTKEDINYCS